MGMAMGVSAPVMPVFASAIGINTLEYGMMTSMMGWTRLIMNVPAAWATDHFGRKPLLISGPLIATIAMTGTATANSYSQMMLWRLMLGMGESFQMSGAQTSLTDLSTAKNRARTIAPMQMCWSAGMALGPILGGYLGDYLINNKYGGIFKLEMVCRNKVYCDKQFKSK
ncbi:major facilitator superfamily [Reticulomyxa filosa]|uniref:Major facilitator superfamily n=1 Tax=Reticulomyxa filosa TaxID=46433 RepID=X6LAE4_RETFI|nr:major facilitator superfamily [Reticulomyxa filosa]|eukprot:ETN98325.1 major facilitator superfamily [Reticulomyxa filosa]